MIERMEEKKKKLQSSVIVTRNEIDSHSSEHEITLADDTAVTVPETQHNLCRAETHAFIPSDDSSMQTVKPGEAVQI